MSSSPPNQNDKGDGIEGGEGEHRSKGMTSSSPFFTSTTKRKGVEGESSLLPSILPSNTQRHHHPPIITPKDSLEPDAAMQEILAHVEREASPHIHRESSSYLHQLQQQEKEGLTKRLLVRVFRKIHLHRIYLPILTWLPRYQKQNFFWDANAGLVVGVLLVPQGMAYAVLAGLPPVFGLYTAIFPNFIYAVMGTSRESAVAAMALVAIMVESSVLSILETASSSSEDASSISHMSRLMISEDRIVTALRLNFLVGVIQFLLGLFKLGTITSFVSMPVMTGFNTAGGILIIISQLKYLLGIKVPSSPYAYQTLTYLLTHLGQTRPSSILIGLCVFAFLYLVGKWKKSSKPKGTKLDRYLRMAANFALIIAIVVSTLVSYILEMSGAAKVQKIGALPQGFRLFPSYALASFTELTQLLPQAFTLAIISFLISFGVAKRYAIQRKYEIDANQDLVGMGLGNLIGSCFGCFTAAGGLARTSVNVEAGARTQMSSLIACLLVTLSVNLFTSLFYYIPMSALAALIQVAVISSIDFAPFFEAYHCPTTDFFVLMTTSLITFLLGITSGILVGIAASIVCLLLQSSYPSLKVCGKVKGDSQYRHLLRFPSAEIVPGICVLRLDDSISFNNADYIKEKLIEMARELETQRLVEGAIGPNFIVLDASGVNSLDMTGCKGLMDAYRGLRQYGVYLLMARVKGTVRDVLKTQPKLLRRLGGEKTYLDVNRMVEILRHNRPVIKLGREKTYLDVDRMVEILRHNHPRHQRIVEGEGKRGVGGDMLLTEKAEGEREVMMPQSPGRWLQSAGAGEGGRGGKGGGGREGSQIFSLITNIGEVDEQREEGGAASIAVAAEGAASVSNMVGKQKSFV